MSKVVIHNITGNPFSLDAKWEAERLFQNAPEFQKTDKIYPDYVYNPVDALHEKLDSFLLKKQVKFVPEEIDTTSQNSCIACNRVAVIEGDGCCHVEPVFSSEDVNTTSVLTEERLYRYKNRDYFLQKLQDGKIKMVLHSPHISNRGPLSAKDCKGDVLKTKSLRKNRKVMAQIKGKAALKHRAEEIDAEDFL